MPLLVSRSAGPAPATSGREADLSGYGRTAVAAGGHPGPVLASASASVGSVSTPLGPVLVVAADDRLAGLYFDSHARTPALDGLPRRRSATLDQVGMELAEYFAGTRISFDVPILLEGTPFQVAVWRALIEIPSGTTSTYGEIARQLGRPQGARAVGAANGLNPISIIVPCHRLVGADGSLTGYGWGLDRKRRLLELERQAREGRVELSRVRA